ncbi:Hypothetical predicted protein [Octopus vulgaris]|uniref:Uncharacterized protein n=1 Tax=Octopus vulgaris TaxID=6645 RepID=A0AA36B8P7_OCTVU|nr:Hypothetical predicted protein [Octopus vulgaris]
MQARAGQFVRIQWVRGLHHTSMSASAVCPTNANHLTEYVVPALVMIPCNLQDNCGNNDLKATKCSSKAVVLNHFLPTDPFESYFTWMDPIAIQCLTLVPMEQSCLTLSLLYLS